MLADFVKNEEALSGMVFHDKITCMGVKFWCGEAGRHNKLLGSVQNMA